MIEIEKGRHVITHAQISRYKSVAEANIDFGKINLLVGQNANGKSNIVDALYFVHDAVNEDLDTAIVKRHGIDSIRQWSKHRPYHISIELSIRNTQGYGKYRLSIASSGGSYKVIEEYGEWTGEDIFDKDESEDQHISKERKTYFTRNRSGRVSCSTIPDMPGRKDRFPELPASDLFATTLSGPYFSIYAILLRPLVEEIRSFVLYSIYPNTLRQPTVVSRLDRLVDDGSNLPSILKIINNGHKSNKESILDSLRLIMPNLSDIIVKSAGGYYVPIIQVREPSGDSHQFNMSQISDGTLRVLGILAAFYQPNAPNLIALEEPEQMIHPGILPILSEAAKEFVSANEYASRQVFLTTHSPTMIDLFEPESIIWTRQVEGLTHSGPITARQLKLVKEKLFSAGEIFLAEGFLNQ